MAEKSKGLTSPGPVAGASGGPADTPKEKPENQDETAAGMALRCALIPKPRGRPYMDESKTCAGSKRVHFDETNNLADPLDEFGRKPNPTPGADELFSPWEDVTKPLRYANVAAGLSMAIALVADVAVNGAEKLTHDRCWLPVQFLRTVMNDRGEVPPNILKLLEHIDLSVKDKGKPKDNP